MRLTVISGGVSSPFLAPLYWRLGKSFTLGSEDGARVLHPADVRDESAIATQKVLFPWPDDQSDAVTCPYTDV
jgi:hypothetical protein